MDEQHCYLDGVDQSFDIGIDDNQYQLPVSILKPFKLWLLNKPVNICLLVLYFWILLTLIFFRKKEYREARKHKKPDPQNIKVREL